MEVHKNGKKRNFKFPITENGELKNGIG